MKVINKKNTSFFLFIVFAYPFNSLFQQKQTTKKILARYPFFIVFFFDLVFFFPHPPNYNVM